MGQWRHRLFQAGAGNPDAILRARRMGKSFGAARVLQDVSLDLKPGEILAVVGENGAGKSASDEDPGRHPCRL